MSAVAYRFEDVRYAGDEEGTSGPLLVKIRKYPVLKKTPKGFWIDAGFGTKRFILEAARKQFACRSKRKALASFIARKNRQISIYAARLADAREALNMAKIGLYSRTHSDKLLPMLCCDKTRSRLGLDAESPGSVSMKGQRQAGLLKNRLNPPATARDSPRMRSRSLSTSPMHGTGSSAWVLASQTQPTTSAAQFSLPSA